MKDSNQKKLTDKQLGQNLIKSKDNNTLSNSISNNNNNNNNQIYTTLAQEMKSVVTVNPKRNQNIHYLNPKLYLHSKLQTSKKKSKQKQKIKTKTKSLNDLIKIIYKNFNRKYSNDKNYYNVKVINEIISNDSSHIVAEFKDYLITGDYNEFIHKYFKLSQSKFLLNQIFEYYALSSVIYPNYIILPENKYIYKNIQKKQKIIDDQQEIEENKEVNDPNKQILKEEGDISKETILTSKVIDSILNQTNSSQNKKFFDVSEQSIVEDLKITQIVQAIDKEDKKTDNSTNKNVKNNISKINKAINVHQKPKLNLDSKSKTSRNVYNKKIISNIESEVNINKNKNSKNKEIAKKNANRKIISRNKINSILGANSKTNLNTMEDFYTYNLETNTNTKTNNSNSKKEFFKTINSKFGKHFLSKFNYEQENEIENSDGKKQNAVKKNIKNSDKKLVNNLFNEKNSNIQSNNKNLKSARLIEKNNLPKEKINSKRELSNNSVNNKNKKLKSSTIHISNHKAPNLKQILGMNNNTNNENNNINNNDNNSTYISKKKNITIDNNNNTVKNAGPSKNAKFLFNKKKIRSRNNTAFCDISPNTVNELKDSINCYNLNNANTICETLNINKTINNTVNNNTINNNEMIGINIHKTDNNTLTMDNGTIFNNSPRTFYTITDANINIKNTGNKRILYRKIITNNYSNKNAQQKNSINNFWMSENNPPLSARDNRQKKAFKEMYDEKVENEIKNNLQLNKNEIPSNIIRKRYAYRNNPVSLSNKHNNIDKNKKVETKINTINDFDSDLSNLMNKTAERDLSKTKTTYLLNKLNLNQIIPRVNTFSNANNYEDQNLINCNRINKPSLNTQINSNHINIYSQTTVNNDSNKILFKKDKKKSEILIGNIQENYYNVKVNIDNDNNKIIGEYNPIAFQKHSKMKSTQLSSAANLNINFNNYNTNVFLNKNDIISENELYNGNKMIKAKNGAKKNLQPLHIKGFEKIIIKKDNKKNVFKPITYRDKIKTNNKF